MFDFLKKKHVSIDRGSKDGDYTCKATYYIDTKKVIHIIKVEWFKEIINRPAHVEEF